MSKPVFRMAPTAGPRQPPCDSASHPSSRCPTAALILAPAGGLCRNLPKILQSQLLAAQSCSKNEAQYQGCQSTTEDQHDNSEASNNQTEDFF